MNFVNCKKSKMSCVCVSLIIKRKNKYLQDYQVLNDNKCSISLTCFGQLPLNINGPFSVIRISSSILMPIPRYLRQKNKLIKPK